jgi:seryl-tRNA synthetase
VAWTTAAKAVRKPGMLDLRYVVDNLEQVRAALATRSDKDAALLEPISELSQRRLTLIGGREERAARRNAASKEMAKLDKKSEEFASRRDDLKALSAELKQLEQESSALEGELTTLLSRIPNLPDGTTPVGKSEDDNAVVHTWGEERSYQFEPKPHYDIGVDLGILDFERAAKLSGPRFTVSFGAAARLERALIHFMLQLHTSEHGYTEVLPPFLIKGETLYGTGQLPKFESDLFKTQKSDPDKSYSLYLSPTAEVPLTNLHAGEILEADQLPVAYAAYTPCFRSEAGSYGRDVRGMIRQHQFNKVELVRLCRPEDSNEQLELLTSHAETVLKRLELRFQRVSLCSGDIGFAAAKTYDLEVWLPSQQKFREISSCSNCTDFQARRAKIRYRPEKGAKPRLLHTLNGSGLAVGRTVVAILEQYQQADGTVAVPDALRDAMGCDRIEKRS